MKLGDRVKVGHDDLYHEVRYGYVVWVGKGVVEVQHDEGDSEFYREDVVQEHPEEKP